MSVSVYIKSLLGFTLALALLVVGFNYVVDPYAITGVTRIEGLNARKTDINNYTRLSKKYQPLDAQYTALIVGNSRVEMGLNPQHQCFQSAGQRVYNLGIPGASLRQQLAYAMNVIYQQPVEQVWLSLDFTDFLLWQGGEILGLVDFDEYSVDGLEYLPSGESNPQYFQQQWMDYYKSLFSLDATISSLKTVLTQSSQGPDRDTQGFNPARDFGRAVAVEGPAALFAQKMEVLENSYDRPLYLRNDNGRLGHPFRDLQRFLDLAGKQSVSVVAFTNPFHEQYWGLFERYGLMPLYREWQTVIVEQMQQNQVPLWDFSADSEFIHEPVPASGKKTGPLQWFWEPAHYREQLGDRMIEAIVPGCDGERAGFGIRVAWKGRLESRPT
tara:strand:- start:11065 stop:12216 length:1152 start_codon:yes stop_codon:yes gene_type:complete